MDGIFGERHVPPCRDPVFGGRRCCRDPAHRGISKISPIWPIFALTQAHMHVHPQPNPHHFGEPMLAAMNNMSLTNYDAMTRTHHPNECPPLRNDHERKVFFSKSRLSAKPTGRPNRRRFFPSLEDERTFRLCAPKDRQFQRWRWRWRCDNSSGPDYDGVWRGWQGVCAHARARPLRPQVPGQATCSTSSLNRSAPAHPPAQHEGGVTLTPAVRKREPALYRAAPSRR